MISILEALYRSQYRGHQRPQPSSLLRLRGVAKTRNPLTRDSMKKVALQSSLTRGKVPPPKKGKLWVGRFTTHRR